MVQQFTEWTLPNEPFKELTDAQTRTMYRCFGAMYSWSNVDADGRIILGNGMDEGGMNYIRENDLNELLHNTISNK